MRTTIVGGLTASSQLHVDMPSLQLAKHLNNSILWSVALLDQFTDRDRYAMGGGSVLAARWNHRFSTDIDLFFDLTMDGAYVPLDEISKHVTLLHERGDITELRQYESGFTCQTPFGSMSFFATNRLTSGAVTDELENLTGIATESTTEILLKKIRARMIHSTDYLARDVYDIVVAYLEDRESLNEAMEYLTDEELRALVFDARSGAIQVRYLERILEPVYTEVTSSFEDINRFAEAILSQAITPELSGELEKIKSNKRQDDR